MGRGARRDQRFDLVGRAQGVGGLAGAQGGADQNFAFRRQVFQQPAGNPLRLLFAAPRQAAFEVGDLAVGIFGFCMAPEDQVHK